MARCAPSGNRSTATSQICKVICFTELSAKEVPARSQQLAPNESCSANIAAVDEVVQLPPELQYDQLPTVPDISFDEISSVLSQGRAIMMGEHIPPACDHSAGASAVTLAEKSMSMDLQISLMHARIAWATSGMHSFIQQKVGLP